MINLVDTNGINNVAQLIQLSVAPVFLLAGVAGILNLFNIKLARIIDKIDKLDKFEKDIVDLQGDKILEEKIKKRRDFLSMRMKNTNLAILFGTTTALLVALVILTLFLSSIFHFKDYSIVAILFILSMISLIISLILFLKEIHYTSTFINNKQSYII